VVVLVVVLVVVVVLLLLLLLQQRRARPRAAHHMPLPLPLLLPPEQHPLHIRSVTRAHQLPVNHQKPPPMAASACAADTSSLMPLNQPFLA